MTLKSKNIGSCDVTRKTAAIVAELRVARDHEKCFVIAWPQSDEMSAGWHEGSEFACGCGCGPVQ
jgi:hypothetical protein